MMGFVLVELIYRFKRPLILVLFLLLLIWRLSSQFDVIQKAQKDNLNSKSGSKEAEINYTEIIESDVSLGTRAKIVENDAFIPDRVLNKLVYSKISWEMVDDKWKLHEKSEGLFFVYQPSGGWGNQRMILKNAIAAANGMNRILVLPKIAPHNFLWYGYERFNSSETVSMAELLDIENINSVVKKGVKVYNGTLTELRRLWRKKRWKIYTKPRYVMKNGKPTKERLFFSSTYMRRTWRPKTMYDVIFFNKGGMWLCCGPSNQYSKSIGFNNFVKAAAIKLIRLSFNMSYNAVHVRRGGGHTSFDRKTANSFYSAHLKHFNSSMPLFIATDEKNRAWFNPFKNRYGFQKLTFWSDLDQEVIKIILKNFPIAMHGDISGFIEQLICAKAVNWAGSHGSTFSAAIGVFRKYKRLRQLKL